MAIKFDDDVMINPHSKGTNRIDDAAGSAAEEDQEQSGQQDVNQQQEAKPVATKRKPGRPKTKSEPTKMINIAIPVSIYDQMQVAKVCYDGSMTKYINTVIRKDLQKNQDRYEMIARELNNFN